MKGKLSQADSIVVVIDVQEAFRSAIADFPFIVSNIARGVRGFQILDVPVVVTEQYPAGLGRTADEILLSLPDNFTPLEKTTFSAFAISDFRSILESSNRTNVILCGIETHICVNQTANDLMANGFSVHVLQDCVGSRFESDKAVGLSKMRHSGAVDSCVEMALFEIMSDSKHGKFKEIQSLIK